MLSDEVLDKVISRITTRIEQANTFVLKKIGEKIKEIGMLTPSDAFRLQAIIKYGGDYDKIVKELSRITNLNVQDIYKIFEEVAKTDQQFAKQFYKYRNKKFIPYEKNVALQQQVEAIARQTAQDYVNLSNTLAFSKIENGKVVYTNLARTYQDTIDKAILSVSQGKSTFQEQMYSVIKELASSGLKMVNYDSGRSYRADSMVRMHLKDGLRGLHNQMQQMLGEDFDADGVEISAHTNPAEDHEEVQGRQFSNEEYSRLNNGLEAKDYKGKIYTLDHDGKNGYRPISTMNCYHYIFSIVLGVSEPEYTDKELQKIKEDNEKGFELDGKHYSMYQGTQLQRQLELEIRKQKDTQIMAKASGNMELVQESQQKITQLTNKYKELTQTSGLPSKLERARVSEYKRVKVGTPKIEAPKVEVSKDDYTFFISKEDQTRRLNYKAEHLQKQINEAKEGLSSIPTDSTRSWDVSMRKFYERDIKKYNLELETIKTKKIDDKTIKLTDKNDCKSLLEEINIKLQDKNIEKIDNEVLISTTKKYYELTEKYPFLEKTLQERDLKLGFDRLEAGNIGEAERSGRKIELDISNFSDKEDTIFWGEHQTTTNYNMPSSKEDYINYFQTHEMGHTFNYRALDYLELPDFEKLSAREFTQKANEYFVENIYKIAEKDTGKSRNELLEMLSDYGKTNIDETMAELFANANCGKPNALGLAFDKYFKELLK